MAKKSQTGKQHGGNNGGQSKQGGSIKGSDCAKTSTLHRESTRKEEARLAQARQALKATGEFFLQQNDGHEVDVLKIEAGVIGEYAIPGGDKPSVHVHVSEMGTAEKSLRVVFFDTAHEGSGLPGNLSTDTYLPVWTLSKDSFISRMEGHGAETQNQLFSFLTNAIDGTRAQMAKDEVANKLAVMLNNSDRNLWGIKRGQLGNYTVTKGDGVAVLRVFIAKHVSVSVLHSTITELQASKAFLPIQQLNFAELRQVTTEDVYQGQLAIHSFLKPILDGLVEEEPTEASRPNLRIVEASPVTTLATMAKEKTGTVSVKQIMSGATGVTVFISGEQSLTVKVWDKETNKGPIRLFEVIECSGFSESAMLSIEVGTFVTAEQLITQAISKAEAAGLPPKTAGAKLALITFILKARKSVKFCKVPSEAILPRANGLRLVA